MTNSSTRQLTDMPEAAVTDNSCQIITQQELAHYRDLERLNSERASLRRRFVRLHESGARVEDGPLMLSVLQCEEKRLTRASIQQIFGEGFVAWLKEQIQPRRFHRVSVRSTPPARPACITYDRANEFC